MTKKILALLFILSFAVNLSASECIITEQNENNIVNENNTTYALLIGMHKNNALTAENLTLLTKTQSIDSFIEILTTQKEDLQRKINSEKLNRAAKSMFSRVGKKWAGLVAAVPASWTMGRFIYEIFLKPMNDAEWTKYNKPGSPKIRTEIIKKIINQTTTSTHERIVSLEPNWTTAQLETGVTYVSFAIGAYIALNCAQELYQHYSHIRNYETEINRIDAIIETIDALHIA